MASSSDRPLKRANPGTIQDKFMVGYQGWFSCAGDGPVIDPGHHGWIHWIGEPLSNPRAHPNIDLWPDTSAYTASELYPCPGIEMQDGSTAVLFSSRHPKTVQRHFHWMAEHGVDGAFLQRFCGECDVDRGGWGTRRLRDEVGDRVREAAEKEGRVFAIMYDLSGLEGDRIHHVIHQDWAHLVREKNILNSPSYLKEKGKPVIALWGLGFEGRGYSPEVVRNLARSLKAQTPGGAYIIAGVPGAWRSCQGDADNDKEWVDVYLNEFDCITPWTIGRYHDEDANDRFVEEHMKGDVELVKKHNQGNESKGKPHRVDYMPVVFPGFSGLNMTKGTWKFNQIKRNGGKFLWRQIWNARRLGVRTIYGAMWDEYDEGTALLPVVANKRQLPKQDKWPFLSLDVDGHDLPSDWYMRICGFGGEGLRGERFIHETFPVKELQDYWAHRPRYEDTGASAAGGSSAAGSSTDGAQSFQSWEATQSAGVEEAPPPPYTLEAGESQPAAPTLVPPQPTINTRPVPPSLPGNRPETQASPPPSTPLTTRPVSPSVPMQGSSMDPQALSNIVASLGNVAITPQPHRQPSIPPRPVGSLEGSSAPQAPFAFPEPSREPTLPPRAGSMSQEQWPPAEWNAPSNAQSSYAGMQPMPSLGRAQSAHAYANSRPAASGLQSSASLPPRPASQASSSSHSMGVLSTPVGHSSSDPSWPNDNKPFNPGMPHGPSSQTYFTGHLPQPHYSSGPGSQPQPYSPYAAPVQPGYYPAYGGGAPTPPPGNRPASGQSYHTSTPPVPLGGQGWPAGGTPPAIPARPQGANPPAPPPRPNNTYPGQYYAQPAAPYNGGSAAAPGAPGVPGTANQILSSAPINVALGTVERFTSQGTRRQIEKGVEGLAQSGSKFFARFNK